MIEIVFGESTAGSLKFAKSMKQGDHLSSSTDVEALTLTLDIGDISDMDTDMNARKKLLDDMFKNFPGVSETIWKTNQHALTRLQEAKETLEPVRVWICVSNPAELCGLYFVCCFMADAHTPLSLVCVPEQIEKDNCIINYRNTGEIVPEAFGTFTKYEVTISVLKRRIYSNIWSSLMRENAPLRVLINGNLIGVPKDFYDFGLRANMPDGDFKIAELIGRTLIQISGIGDHWLFLRIQTMLQTGELIMVSAATGENPYSAVLKRSNEIVCRSHTSDQANNALLYKIVK